MTVYVRTLVSKEFYSDGTWSGELRSLVPVSRGTLCKVIYGPFKPTGGSIRYCVVPDREGAEYLWAYLDEDQVEILNEMQAIALASRECEDTLSLETLT